jgi:hypothetical protein
MRNTISNILKTQPHTNKYNTRRRGFYCMKCLDCPKKYIGQMGRTFNTSYKEHIYDIRSNNSNTGYVNHILNTGHIYGPIDDVMEIMEIYNPIYEELNKIYT